MSAITVRGISIDRHSTLLNILGRISSGSRHAEIWRRRRLLREILKGCFRSHLNSRLDMALVSLSPMRVPSPAGKVRCRNQIKKTPQEKRQQFALNSVNNDSERK